MSPNWTEQQFCEFLDAFAATTGLPRQGEGGAFEQWAGFSRSLSDMERTRLEAGGAPTGRRMGRDFLRLYPVEERD